MSLNRENPDQGLRVETAHEYLERVIKELQMLDGGHKGQLLSVLEYLSLHIRRTREEVSTLRPNGAGPDLLSSSADELEEILSETARAANEIMGAAEAIEEIGAKTKPEIAEALMAAVTRIYEASAFQDITGQRITKVVRALQHIEGRIDALVRVCTNGDAVLPQPPQPSDEGEAGLLNGPQLGKDAITQGDVDRLFGD